MPDLFLIAEATIAAAVAALLALWFRHDPRNPTPAVGIFASVLGIVIGLVVLLLPLHFPPRDVLDRIVGIIMPTVVVTELLACVWNRPAWILRFIVAAAATPVILYGSTYITNFDGPGSRDWSLVQCVFVFVGLTGILTIEWILLHRFAERVSGIAILMSLIIANSGAALCVMQTGYATGGQFGFPIAGALFGVAIGSFATRPATVRGAIGIGLVGLFSLLMAGRFFGGLTTFNAAILFAAPSASWIAPIIPINQRCTALSALALSALPVLIGVYGTFSSP